VNFLGAILDHSRAVVAERKKAVPLDLIRDRPLYGRTPLSLAAALRGRTPAVIAEIKQGSPSRGVICRDFNPGRTARQYQAAGAAALSVLTEEKHFLGSLGDLEEARRAASIPILRKDFILDSYQVHEAKSAGADAVLLIAAALGPGEIASLAAEARALGMEALVEIHSERELDSLRELELPLIGINNRDLVTFETDLALSLGLGPAIPRESLAISESGIRTGKDISRLASAGIGAFLVGEHLMRSDDPGKALAELLREAGDRP
jgi:indole-3-glycerol phosphate synthase